MRRFTNSTPSRYIPYSMRLLAAMLVVTVVVATVIGLALCQVALYLIQEMESTLTQKNIQIIGENLNRSLASVDKFSAEIASSAYVQALRSDETIHSTQPGLSSYLERQVADAYENYAIHANFVNLYMKSGLNCIQYKNLPYTDFEDCVQYYLNQNAIKNSRYTPMTWVSCTQLQDLSGKTINSLIWIRFLYDSLSGEKIGILVGGVNETIFKDFFGILPHAYLCQGSGTILSSTDSDFFPSGVSPELQNAIQSKQPQISIISWAPLNQCFFFWKDVYYSLLLIVPETSIQQDMTNLTGWYTTCTLVIILIGVLIGTLINYYLSKRLSHSILSLRDTVQQVDHGDLSARYTIPSQHDEISYLGEHFNHMLDSLDRIYVNQERDALARKDLEIQLLQSQINPHLLYNTLNSVALAIRNDQRQTAEDLLFTLSDFIRLSLSKGQYTVPLSTELQLLQKYILLQKLASHRDIRLEIDVPDPLLSAVVIRTSLQPIVENSVLHGLSGYRTDGIIRVTGRSSEDRNTMTLSVWDNGLGIEPDKLDQLNQTINTKNYHDMCSHFGLYNVNWRIKYTWGSEAYGITLHSEVTDYTEVTMTLPLIDGERKEADCPST